MRVGVVNSSETYNLAVHKIANYHRILGDEVTRAYLRGGCQKWFAT
jgi:hypothetical protein